METNRLLGITLLLCLSAAGCGDTADTGTTKQTNTATATSNRATKQSSDSSQSVQNDEAAKGTSTDIDVVAKTIVKEVNSAVKTIQITEDNDGNNLIGRPNGYSQAIVVTDKTLGACSLSKPGIDCGVVIELWPNSTGASKRADYIQAVQKTSPLLGSEWHQIKGNALIRISGKLKPSLAEKYKKATEADPYVSRKS